MTALLSDHGGDLWITLPFSNRIVALTPGCKLVDIVHEPEGSRISMPTNLGWGEQAIFSSRAGVRARSFGPM